MKAGKVLLSAGNINAHVSIQSVDSSGDPLSFAYVAIGGTHAPKTPAGYGFNDFGFWGPVIDETMVFAAISTASGMPNITGIYSSGSGGLVRLADTRQAVPQGAGNFDFSWYGTRSPIVASNGIVVFGARDVSTNKVGLYAVRQTGGRVKKIIAEGDPIGSSMVMSLDIGRAALSGTTLVFNVGYTFPGGVGFYSTQVILP